MDSQSIDKDILRDRTEKACNLLSAHLAKPGDSPSLFEVLNTEYLEGFGNATPQELVVIMATQAVAWLNITAGVVVAYANASGAPVAVSLDAVVETAMSQLDQPNLTVVRDPDD